MSLLFAVQQQHGWLTFDGGHVSRSDSRPRLPRAAMAVADFEGAVSNVIALEGSAAHAVALIERRLRADGLVDGEAKVLIHKTRTVGAGYQTWPAILHESVIRAVEVRLAAADTLESADLPNFDLISGGAIANAVLFVLHRLPAIEDGLQTARGFGGAFVLGIHSFAKLSETYGKEGIYKNKSSEISSA